MARPRRNSADRGAHALRRVLSGELEVIAAVPGEGDEEDVYDGEGRNGGGHTWMVSRKRGGSRLIRLTENADAFGGDR